MKVFLAGAVTGCSKVQMQKYQVYDETLKEIIPQLELTTPDVIWEYRNLIIKKHPEFDTQKIDEEMLKFDLKKVRDSDCIVCDLSALSTGMGIELGVAVENKKKIVFFYEHSTKVGSMITGAFPLAEFIEYKNGKDMVEKLKAYFNNN